MEAKAETGAMRGRSGIQYWRESRKAALVYGSLMLITFAAAVVACYAFPELLQPLSPALPR